MPPAMRPRYARHLRRLLRPDVQILLITLNYEQTQMSGPPFAVQDEEIRDLFGGRFHIRRLAQVDVLAENERFRERGLTGLIEQVYLLEPP